MAKYLVCVSDERHASYEIERAILEKAGAELSSATAKALRISPHSVRMRTPYCLTLHL